MPDLSVIDATPSERAGIRGVQEALAAPALQPGHFGLLKMPDGQEVPLPAPLCRVLLQAAAALASGYQVIVAALSHQLTTQEAADLLNVSRPHLIKVLDAGEIAHERVGRHRRVKFGDLMDYKRKRMSERRVELERLIEESEELGLYEPPRT